MHLRLSMMNPYLIRGVLKLCLLHSVYYSRACRPEPARVSAPAQFWQSAWERGKSCWLRIGLEPAVARSVPLDLRDLQQPSSCLVGRTVVSVYRQEIRICLTVRVPAC